MGGGGGLIGGTVPPPPPVSSACKVGVPVSEISSAVQDKNVLVKAKTAMTKSIFFISKFIKNLTKAFLSEIDFRFF